MPAGHSDLDAVFAALSDATRRAILARLAAGETSVTDLAAPFAVSLPAISKHLRVLEAAGLVRREKEGRVNWCRLAPEPMRDAAEWLAAYRRFWERQLASLERYLRAARAEEGTWQRKEPRRQPRSGSRGRSRPRPTKSSARSPIRKR